MQFSRRKFLRSLSRSAVVLSLENVLSLARPIRLHAISVPDEKDQKPTDLGVNFIDVGNEAGLNVETIFGGEHKNKYLIRDYRLWRSLLRL